MLSFMEYLIEAKETVVYSNKHGQKVTLTNHVEQDRNHRKWWKSYEDEEFLKFVEPALSILKNTDKKELSFKQEWGIISKDEKKGFIISLRYNDKTDKNDSFSIITILNSDSEDAISSKVFMKGIKDNKMIIINESNKEIPILYVVR